MLVSVLEMLASPPTIKPENTFQLRMQKIQIPHVAEASVESMKRNTRGGRNRRDLSREKRWPPGGSRTFCGEERGRGRRRGRAS